MNEKVIAHAVQRAKERYGLELNKWDLYNIREDIKTGRSLLMSTDDEKNTEQHLLDVGGVQAVVVYHPGQETVISFYDPKFGVRKQSAPRRKSGKLKRKTKKWQETWRNG
jgi:hypothetical protein